MFLKFIQVGLHLGSVYTRWGGGLIFGMLIGFHIWGRIFGGGLYTGFVFCKVKSFTEL